MRRHPSYRYHKARDCAVVTIDGHDYYLGAYDSPESWEKYHRRVAEWLAGDRRNASGASPSVAALTVSELVLRYFKYAQTYYVKNGRPTSEQDNIRQALRFLRNLYGSTPASEFSPMALKAVRQAMVVHPITRKIKTWDPLTGEVVEQIKVLRQGLCRKFINKQIKRICRMFAWAVEEELVSVEIHQALLRVKSLKKGKSAAREKPRIKPVSEATVQATLPLLSPVIQVMVQVQRLSGCRPQDIVQMRSGDIDRNGCVWEYRPGSYKTDHLNEDDDPDLERVVFLGPRAQALLKPFLQEDPEVFLFDPRQAEELRAKERRRRRKTPLWPSHLRHQTGKRKTNPKRAPKEYYDQASYRRAIRRACTKAGIPVWHPHQLRHARLTEIRRHFGLEASQACAGHREIGVTQIYAERDRTLATRVMEAIG
jgi:integrase